MATIVVGEIPSDEFALQDTFRSLPDVEFESERVVENGEDAVMPLLWARGAERDALEEAFAADDSVDEVQLLAEFDEEYLYRMNWVQHVELVLHMILNSNATVLDAYGDGRTWRLRVFYPSRDDLSSTNEFCEELGLSFDVVRVREMESEPSGRFGLTDEQYEALTAAWQAGYFDVPRGAELEDLAEELDVSHQALSERIRRGHSNLIEETLGISAPR